MKKIGLVILLLCSFWTKAQQKEIQMNTVSVSGRALVDREITMYKAKITLNMEQLYYSDPNIKTLDELKRKYFNEVKTQGIDPTTFKENKLEFLTYGYQRDGTILELETSSDDEIIRLANIKMTGITGQYQFKAEVNPEQRAKIIAKAIANAKDNATRVCKVANKKLGEIISISDSSVQDSTWNTYSSTYEEYATIYVTYEMN